MKIKIIRNGVTMKDKKNKFTIGTSKMYAKEDKIE